MIRKPPTWLPASKATRTLLAEKLDAADAAIRRARAALDGENATLSARTAGAALADVGRVAELLERLASVLESTVEENGEEKDA
jgi:hypothetical protein